MHMSRKHTILQEIHTLTIEEEDDDDGIQANIIHLHNKTLQQDMMSMYPSLSKWWNYSWVVTSQREKIEKWHRKSKSQKAPHAWTDGDAGQMIPGEALNQKT